MKKKGIAFLLMAGLAMCAVQAWGTAAPTAAPDTAEIQLRAVHF